MNFHDEIVKLQEQNAALNDRVAALEAKQGTDAPEDPTPVVITPEYLDSLTVDQIGDLYKAGRIKERQLGAAVTRKVFPQGVPAELADEFAPEPEPPAAVDAEQIAKQDEHDRATGNVNEAGQTPAEAVAAEFAANLPVTDLAFPADEPVTQVGAETAVNTVEDQGLES